MGECAQIICLTHPHTHKETQTYLPWYGFLFCFRVQILIPLTGMMLSDHNTVANMDQGLVRAQHQTSHHAPSISLETTHGQTHTHPLTLSHLCTASLHACGAHTHVGQSKNLSQRKTGTSEEGVVLSGGPWLVTPPPPTPTPEVATVRRSLSARGCCCQGDAVWRVPSSKQVFGPLSFIKPWVMGTFTGKHTHSHTLLK